MATMCYTVEERLDWRWWVTPKFLLRQPIHRWYIFPHSFTAELVHQLLVEWNLGPNDHVLDPFAGAGTTLLAAKERGIPATGYDLSPLAVLASRVKTASYDPSRLEELWVTLQSSLGRLSLRSTRDYPELVKQAIPEEALRMLDACLAAIEHVSMSEAERDFFRLALLGIVPLYSRAVRTGGWLKWVQKAIDASTVPVTFANRVAMMLSDLRSVNLPQGNHWRAYLADARNLPAAAGTFSAVITSPPYPNRHDYTRVFGVELMFAFLDWNKTRELRYQSFHSHPEARPVRQDVQGYREPRRLGDVVSRLAAEGLDRRVIRMLHGYFLDMYICLREMRRVCKPGARIAVVVGNARYSGQDVLVDEFTAEVGEQAGLSCERIVAVRYRGNSAQQMGRFGRSPSRESVVFFRVPL